MFPLPDRKNGRAINAVIAWALLSCTGLTHAVDFNGDGTDDFLFRDHTQGGNHVALALGKHGALDGGPTTSIALSTNTSRRRGFDLRTGDFDGDGNTDLLERDLQSGVIRVQLMDGTHIRSGAVIDEIPPAPSARLLAVEDFDGDGRDDLLIDRRGNWSIWMMHAVQPAMGESGRVGFGHTGWRFAGSADFDGDGRADLLLNHAKTTRWRVVRLDGREPLESGILDFVPRGSQWRLEAIEDMNRDGRADLLFRNRSTGLWYTFLLDGVRARPGSGRTAIGEAREWRLQQLDDLNGDGSPDALLARFDTNEWRVDFLLDGQRLAGSGLIRRNARDSSRIAAVGDYDGDGVNEVLVSEPSRWRVFDVRKPRSPRVKVLDMPPPTLWAHACEPPKYRQYARRGKPADLANDYAVVNWKLPTTRDNGEALCAHEIEGFALRYGKIGSDKAHTVRIGNPAVESRRVGALAPGRWWFRIATIDTSGISSRSSARVNKRIP